MADLALFTLGCKVNQAESDELRADLEESGHRVVADPAAADLCVVNTCTVTAESDRKSRKLIRMLARRGASRIVAAGCYAEVCPQELSVLPGVVRVIPNTRKHAWLEEIESLLPDRRHTDAASPPRRSRVFLKVQDGCERLCSYCIVPRARGRERSRPLAEVLGALSRCRETGTGEVVLCGVNLGRYGRGEEEDLAFLVREVLAAEGGHRVRLSSIELEDLRMRWIEEWSGEPRICPHLHLPLQSGSAEILGDMGRGYGPRDFLAAVDRIRSLWPVAALTTEVMVGYPGEDEVCFRETLDVLEAARPARVHVFRFSPRPGTKAWGRGDRADAALVEERSAVLRRMAEKSRLQYIAERRGEKRGMLVERITVRGGERIAYGTTEDYIKGVTHGLAADVREGRVLAVEIYGVEEGRALLRAESTGAAE